VLSICSGTEAQLQSALRAETRESSPVELIDSGKRQQSVEPKPGKSAAAASRTRGRRAKS
jgi:hypothetical protein